MLEESVRQEIAGILAEPCIEAKLSRASELCAAVDRVAAHFDSADRSYCERPQRPADWTVTSADEVPRRPQLTQTRGRMLLMHSVAHIEVSAVELALMAVADFPDQPLQYYRDMLRIAGEEVEHARMLMLRLGEMGGRLGDEPVHLGLYEAAAKHRDLHARLVVVPRVLEARGLDVSASLRRRLRAAGDERSAEALDRIYHDEITHVALGTKWFRRVCEREGRDPTETFFEVAARFRVGRPGDVDVEGRRRAGFTDAEIAFISRQPVADLAES